MTEVVVAGAAGRMGSRVIACLTEAADLRLAAALEAPGHPRLGADAGEVAGVGRLGVAIAAVNPMIAIWSLEVASPPTRMTWSEYGAFSACVSVPQPGTIVAMEARHHVQVALITEEA